MGLVDGAPAGRTDRPEALRRVNVLLNDGTLGGDGPRAGPRCTPGVPWCTCRPFRRKVAENKGCEGTRPPGVRCSRSRRPCRPRGQLTHATDPRDPRYPLRVAHKKREENERCEGILPRGSVAHALRDSGRLPAGAGTASQDRRPMCAAGRLGRSVTTRPWLDLHVRVKVERTVCVRPSCVWHEVHVFPPTL
jgi:hypothetical protein